MPQTHRHRDQAVARIPALFGHGNGHLQITRRGWFSRVLHGMRATLLALAAFTPLAAHAATINGETSDTDIQSNGTISPASGTAMLVGGSGSPVFDRAGLCVFKLPDFGAVANPFTTATFRFNLTSITSTPPNIDLYGLGSRASSTVIAGDYYGQTTTADPSDATFLQNNILVSTTPVGSVSTSASGSTALKNHLNTQYAGGAGAGKYVFLRLSSDSVSTSAKRYTVTSAESAIAGPRIIYNLPSGYSRPFIWVRDEEKAGILAKISGNVWATSVYNGMISRVASDVSSHQSNRDAFLRSLPVDWTPATPKFKTIPAYAESTVRYPAEAKFNDALDCAVLHYLTGDSKYARCAADILHNAVKTLLPVTASASTGNGGWIFQNDLLKEARVTGNQLPIVYDFLYSWLQTNQVYDVKTAAMVNFNFTNAQSVFRKLYELCRDHGQKDSNWSALMATTMLNNLLALDSTTERNAALQIYLTPGSSRQASLSYDYRNYAKVGDIWPESLQYAGGVGSIRTTHMVLLERVDPGLNLFDAYPNLPLSLPRISYLRYPNGEQISFGDGHRSAGGQPFHNYELVYQHALARGRADLTSFFGSLINGGVAAANYNRSSLKDYSTLGTQNEPLQLLWQAASLTEPSVTPELPRADTLPFAGIALQRNPAPANNSTYGLMGFVGGAAHVHSHASGMNMELFGMGQVMGAKAGREEYGSTINENHYRLFAANNTVIVNGASRGEGGWGNFAINTVQTVAMEPRPFATAVSPNFSFTCSSFADNKGTLAEGTQQRTLAIVRTSPTTGYYVDVFRSQSTVTNRTVTTLNGNATNQYHDYIYRNIGETAVDLRADGVTLPLTSQPARFQNDIGDANEQPGWRYFDNTKVSYPTSKSVKAQFIATVSGTARYMDLHMPAVASREYAKVDSPPIVDAPGPYNTRAAPTLVVRQIGEAWNKAFAAVYEPHFGSTGGTVQNVTQLLRGGIVVGVKVESTVLGKNLVQYILSNPGATETYTDASSGLSFTGRFGVASDNGDGTTTLYLGAGSSLSYRGNSVATTSGSSSQAEVRFAPGQTPVVTANTPVNVISAVLPPGATWLPTAGGTGFDWTNIANWNPAVIPDSVGGIARKNINITGDQTVNVNTPVTFGELVVGDSSGSQNTLLQKNTNGSFVVDQTDAGVAYLTRTADGTGSVTFASDLDITLNDNLTVRLAGGTASSTMAIAGTIAGPGRILQKEGDTLTLSLAGANTYSGPTRILGGILSLDHGMALQNSSLDTLNSVTGSATNGLSTTATSLTLGGLTGDKALASLFTTSSGTYSGVTALTLNPESGASPNYSGAIANGAAAMTLAKTGSGTQTLTGTNTYTGSTTLAANSGTLEIGGAGKLGNGAYAGAIAIGTGSIFRYSSSAAQTLSGTISGSGTLIKSIGTSTLTLGGSNTSFAGTVAVSSGTLALGHANALSAAGAITLSGAASLRPTIQNTTINSPITLSGSPTIQAPDFGTGSTVSTLTLGGAISGSGNLILSSSSTVASNSQQTIRLNAQNSHTGSTTLNPADNDANLIVKLGISNALPPATVLAINGVDGGGSGRSAELELNGFSQTLGGLQNTAASLRSQELLNSSATAATLTINNATNHTFSGKIKGTNLSLIKTGSGRQSLAGANTYAGATTINGGKLQGIVGGNCANSSVTINNSLATFCVSITDNTKTWTCAALTSSAAGTLEFDFASVLPGTVTPLTVTGLANFSTSPTVRVVVNTGLVSGTWPLMTWDSTSGTAPTLVTIVKSDGTSAVVDGTAASLAVAANTLNLVITANDAILTKANNTNNLNLATSWVGGVPPDLTTTARWSNTVTSANATALGADVTWAGITILDPVGLVTVNAGNTLTLGANANDINMSAATANLTLNCPLILGDANVWNVTSGRTLTIASVVSGSFPITKEGAGMAVLSGANTYTGNTTLSANSGTLEIGAAGKLGNGTYAGAIEIAGGSIFKYNSSATQTLNGALNGSGTLTKNASSTLTLGASNTSFTGTVAINAGTLNLGHASALGDASTLSIAGGATLSSQVTGLSTNVPITLGAAATNSTISFSRNTAAAGAITLGGPISGGANLIFTTPNVVSGGTMQTIFLGYTNTYTGNTTLTSGNINNSTTIRAGIANSLPATTVLTLNGGNGAGSGRAINFDLNGFDQMLAGLTNTTGLSLRTQKVLNNSAEAATLTINNSSNYTFSGIITGTALDLFKSGAGTQTLTGANTYAGITSVAAGILSLGHSLAMQNSTLETLDSVAGDAANGLRTSVTTLTLGGLSGDKNLASVFTTTSGGYSGVTALTLKPDTEATRSYSGIIADGATGMILTKSGLGTQILSGTNTYTGSTTISAGMLALGADDVIPNISNVVIGNATLNASTFTDTLGTLDVTSTATIHLDIGAALAFADSSASDWTGGTLDITGTLVSGASLRFGTTGSGLTAGQLSLITINGTPATLSLNSSGYLSHSEYSAWTAENAPNTGDAPSADEDGDGVSNGIEYVLGGTAATNDLAKLPVATATDGNLVFSFIRNQESIDGTTTVAIEVGNNLVSWPTSYLVPAIAVANSPGVSVQKNVPAPNKDTVTLTLPLSGLTKFARLKVIP